MKIIHTSDWHLAHTFAGYDRTDEFNHFLGQLALIAADEKPDAIVVCGDIFHVAAPPIAAQKQFTDGLLAIHNASPESAIIVTSGNHDSGTRLETTKELWRTQNVHICGSFSRDADAGIGRFVVELPGKGWIIATPFFPTSYFPILTPDSQLPRMDAFFATLQDYVEARNSEGLPVVLMAHLAIDGCNMRGHEAGSVAGMETEQISRLGAHYDYLALGHIHMPQTLTARARYCGTPIAVSFSETYTHSVTVVEIAAHGSMPQVRTIDIDQLRPVLTVRAESTAEATNLLGSISNDEECYVKVEIAPSEIVTPLTISAMQQAVDGKRCRLCDVVNSSAADVRSANNEADHAPTLEAVKARNPLELACEYFKKKAGEDMPADLRQMLKELIDDVTFSDPQ